MPKISTGSKRSDSASRRLRTPSPGREDEQRTSSDDERISDSDDDGDDDDDDFSRHQSQQKGTESLDRRSLSENMSLEHQDFLSNDLLSTVGSHNSGIRKVSVTRNRTRALLQARG